jgi:hypothetical protein
MFFKWLNGEAHGLSVLGTLVAFLERLIFFIRAGWGDRDG